MEAIDISEVRYSSKYINDLFGVRAGGTTVKAWTGGETSPELLMKFSVNYMSCCGMHEIVWFKFDESRPALCAHALLEAFRNHDASPHGGGCMLMFIDEGGGIQFGEVREELLKLSQCHELPGFMNTNSGNAVYPVFIIADESNLDIEFNREDDGDW